MYQKFILEKVLIDLVTEKFGKYKYFEGMCNTVTIKVFVGQCLKIGWAKVFLGRSCKQIFNFPSHYLLICILVGFKISLGMLDAGGTLNRVSLKLGYFHSHRPAINNDFPVTHCAGDFQISVKIFIKFQW